MGLVRSRRFQHGVLAVTLLGCLGIVYEASFRARLEPPLARVPTSLYSRPTSWHSTDRQITPVPVGVIDPEIAEYRIPVRLGKVSESLIQAVLAVEDQRFLSHHGLDLWRIGGAAVANLKSGGIRQGGSTITQQLAKNLFLTSRRTPLRKLREAAMAAVLEDRYDKKAILEAYLNEIYLGQDGGDAIRGVGAGARYYFGKDPSELTLGESALLAGMIQAPNRYTPVRNPGIARKRRDLVLRLMLEQERISKKAAARASRERIRSKPYPRPGVPAPHFRDWALKALARDNVRLAQRGAALYTTLDADLQRSANRAVQEGLKRLSRDAQAALVALDPRSGEVLALVGGRDYRASQFNRATDARRQPGSAFKPIVALAALGRPHGDQPRFTLASKLRDEPFRVDTPAGPWEPMNYDRDFRGEVTVREAMEQSLNVPFARMGLAVGPQRIVSTARDLGISSPLNPVPSLALGTSEVTLLELTRAYGTLAAEGYRAEPRALLGMTRYDGAGRTLERRRGTRVVDRAEAYLVTSALEGVVARGTGRALGEMTGWNGGLAGKSGTSNDWRDAWFIAYTPSLVVGVWVGHDDGRSLGVPGARAALPIVQRFLRDAFRQQGPEPFPVPDGIEITSVGSGFFSWIGFGCGEREVFLQGTAPSNRCGSFDRGERWQRNLDDDAEEWIEELEDHADELIRRLTEQLLERGRRSH
jgi:penicillin-binding protein 1B